VKLSDLVTEAQRLAGRVDPNWYSRTARWINEAQEQWSIGVPWNTLIEEESFISDGAPDLLLPSRVQTVMWIADTANARPLIKSDHWEREIPNEFLKASTGTTFLYREVGVDAVIKPSFSSDRLLIEATATDTASIYIEGLATDSAASGYADALYRASETIDVINLSTYTTANVYVKVDVIGKDKYTVGDYIIRGGGVGTLARLNSVDLRTKYRHLELAPIPAAGTVLYVQYLKAPTPLTALSQCPHPAIDEEYLIWYAAGMIRESQGETQQAAGCLARAQQILERRIYKERMFGDKDLRAMPDPNYWNDEDQYQVPTGGGF
jgi:hypothetical protein